MQGRILSAHLQAKPLSPARLHGGCSAHFTPQPCTEGAGTGSSGCSEPSPGVTVLRLQGQTPQGWGLGWEWGLS